MKNKVITKQDFLNMKVSDISQVYVGKRECCRCGCGGEYIATTFMENPRSEVDDQQVEEFLIRAKKTAAKKGSTVMYGYFFVDVRIGKNKTLTFYNDELKEKEDEE